MKRLLCAVCGSLILPGCFSLARAQDAASLVERGETAAHDDRHAEAIAFYEQAIRLDQGLRDDLLPKLGVQYLWSDNSGKAVELLGEYLQTHAEDCDTRLDFSLALSWADQLEKSKAEYQEVERNCPERAAEARLGQARVLRWMDRSRKADAAYGDVIWREDPWDKDPDHQRDARLGLAQDSLAMDDNRSARDLFAEMIESGSKDPDAFEGEAVAAMHLGLPNRALEVLEAAKQAGVSNPRLKDVEDHIRRVDQPTFSPSFSGFNDADGTSYRAAEVTAAFGWAMRGRAELTTGTSRLASASQAIDARWAGLAVEQRFNPSWAVRAESRLTEYSGVNFKPVTAELDGIWTPRDSSRVDFAAARIQESDNLAALHSRLAGIFVSAGTDERLTDHDSVSVSVDNTHWNQGSVRMRYRLNPSHHFESLHEITIEVPTLFQTYNHGFGFQVFSPRRYIETGPRIGWSRWYRHHWQVSLHARLGFQKESADSWKGLGEFETQLERELWKTWGFQCAASWSDSALASPTGFRRRSFSVGLQHRF